MQLDGKLGLPGRLNAVAPGFLVHIMDQISGRRFLVDTGAAFSILPHSSHLPALGQGMVGPTGSPIKCWGESQVDLQLSGQLFTWIFLLADVQIPILGIDFLRANKLSVDPAGGRLLQEGTGLVLSTITSSSGATASAIRSEPEAVLAAVPVPGGRAATSSPAVPVLLQQAASTLFSVPVITAVADKQSPVSQPPPPPGNGRRPAAQLPLFFQLLLQRFQDVVNPSKVLPPSCHGVEHHLRTEGPPIASPFRRLDAAKLAAAKAEFAQMEKDGIIRRSCSPWASPLHLVKKPDGSWRPCGDYRRLNGVTVPDTYPLPNMMDFSARVAGCKFFSKIDLRKGYHQIPMHPADIPKTAIITPFGLFEFLRLTFGLRNAGSTFQRLMDRVLAGLPMVFVYLDDIIIASSSMEDHQRDVEEVFRRLRAASLVINREKCEFAVPEVQFLGHHVTAEGIQPLQEKVTAVKEHPKPKTVKQLQAFLGVVNFYRRFVPAAAKILRPLTDSLRGSPKATAAVDWSADMERAFADAKAALCKAALLAHPQQGWELAVMVDASADHVGAALQQRAAPSSPWQPLAFFSKKLEPAQVRYSAFDRELYACCAGIRHFRYMLEGRPFTIYTDHKPLTFALSKVADAWTAMQCRQLSYVAEFTTDIRHVPGAENVVADTLSRPPSTGPDSCQPASIAGPDSGQLFSSAGPDSCDLSINAGPDSRAVSAVAPSSQQLDYASIARNQLLCPATQKAMSSTSLKLRHVNVQGQKLLCDVSRGGQRPLIPTADRQKVFIAFHELAHSGIRATRRLMAARVVWRGMSSDIAAWCKDCQQCARGKVSPQPAAPVQPIPVPQRRFSHVHVDIVGPLPTSSEGFSYLLTMVDRSTRWLEAVPMETISAQKCADTFISTWVARYGVPATITSDQGRQFTSSLWTGLHKMLGVQLINTTAYHPQSNGMVERSHGQLKAALRSRLAGVQWPDHLPWVLLGLRTAPKEDSAVSSAELVFGAALSLPAEFISGPEPPAVDFMEKLRDVDVPATRPLSYAEVAAKPAPALFQASHVYVRRGGALPPLAPLYAGPYRVLARQAKFFRLEIGGRMEVVSVDRLKPHLGSSPVVPAAPPTRGRPRAAIQPLTTS